MRSTSCLGILPLPHPALESWVMIKKLIFTLNIPYVLATILIGVIILSYAVFTTSLCISLLLLDPF